MNFSMIIYVLGWVLKLEAGIMILPIICALIYQEFWAVQALAVSAVLSLVIGTLATVKGASILSEVEHLGKGLLFWRSFSHWVGGMGVLVLVLTILPLGGGYNMMIMKAESPGPDVSKIVPRVADTAKAHTGSHRRTSSRCSHATFSRRQSPRDRTGAQIPGPPQIRGAEPSAPPRIF